MIGHKSLTVSYERNELKSHLKHESAEDHGKVLKLRRNVNIYILSEIKCCPDLIINDFI